MIPAPSIPEPVKSAEFEGSFAMELITPMYGGGVEAGVNDRDFPIRAASIRGQLRFWWRATRGAKCKTIKALYDAESEIWGNTEIPSPTRIVVCGATPLNDRSFRKMNNTETVNGRPRPRPFGFDQYGNEAYALFPAKNNKNDILREGYSFELKVTCKSAHRDDVMCALWAWANFGGLGARTRRGCGALYCEKFAPERVSEEDLNDWLRGKINEYGLSQGDGVWPSLSQILFNSNQPVGQAIIAWASAIGAIKEFRQGVNLGRNPGAEKNRPGRSRWPEPDTLRRLVGPVCSRHKASDSIPDGFPRAAFGLPIIFHFVCDCCTDSELRPLGKNRMASPVILRPLKTQNGQCAPMAVLLKAPEPKDLELKLNDRSISPVVPPIAGAGLVAYPNSPMRRRSTGGRAIEAFIAYLNERSFKGVKLP
jgi:CRISPR-associated protein Cmr1